MTSFRDSVLPWIRSQIETIGDHPTSLREVRQDLGTLVAVVPFDYPLAATQVRKIAERIVREVCVQEHGGSSKKPLYDAIESLRQKAILPPRIASYLHTIRRVGNDAVHPNAAERPELDETDLYAVLLPLLRVIEWYYCTYSGGALLGTIYSCGESDPVAALSPDRLRFFFDNVRRRYQPYGSATRGLTDPLRLFVPLRCLPDIPPDALPADAVAWLTDNLTAAQPVLLLADYGMGKSYLALRLFLALAREHRSNPLEPVPILLPLREYRLVVQRQDALLELIDDFLTRNAFPVTGQDNLRRLLAAGKLSVILDGVDEIPYVQTMRLTQVLEHLSLSRFGDVPCVLTSRSGLFAKALPTAPEFRRYTVGRLMKWTSDDWTEYVERCDVGLDIWHSEDTATKSTEPRHVRVQLLHVVKQRPALQELTVTPLYARMLVETWQTVLKNHESINLVQLYRSYSDFVLAGRQSVTLLQNDLEVRRQCLEVMATHFFATKASSCTASELREVALSYVRAADQEDIMSFVATELQTYSLLSCDQEGRFAFSHKSFGDFFLAQAILRAVHRDGWRGSSHLESRLQRSEAEFLASLLLEPEHAALFDSFKQYIVDTRDDTRKEFRRNLVMIGLAAKCSFADRMLGDAYNQIDLSAMDFGGSDLRRARLVNVDATASSFAGADLMGATLVKSNLSQCDLSGANLVGANLQGCTLLNIEHGPSVPRLSSSNLKRLILSRRDVAYLLLAVESDTDGTEHWRDQARRDLDSAIVVDAER